MVYMLRLYYLRSIVFRCCDFAVVCCEGGGNRKGCERLRRVSHKSVTMIVTFKQRTKLTDDAGSHGPLYTAHHLGSPEIIRGQMSKDDQPKSTTVRLKFAPQPSSNEERPNDPQVIDHSGHPQPMASSGRLKRSTGDCASQPRTTSCLQQ
jgi:hypothetical protein